MMVSKVATLSNTSYGKQGNFSLYPKAFILKDPSRLRIMFLVMFSIQAWFRPLHLKVI